MTDIPCVILSGGKSSRMGFDKSFLKIDNIDLIEYQYNKYKELFKNVFISAKTDKFNKKYNLILDDSSIYSPMVALNSILKNIDRVFIVPVDMPNIKKNSIKNLIKSSNSADIALFKTKDKIHNLCGIYSSIVLKKIEYFLKQDIHKIGLLQQFYKPVYIDIDEKESKNINSLNDI